MLQPRYKNVKQINLEFAQDIGDNHLELIRNKVRNLISLFHCLDVCFIWPFHQGLVFPD